MALTATTLRNAKPKAAPYKLANEKGLFLLVQPSGGMLWRMKYRVDGRDGAGNAKRVEKKLSLGTYPDVGLADAREHRGAARRLLAQGKDPADEKRREKQAKKIGAINTFGAVAKACIEKNRRDGLADATIRKREWFVSLVERPLGGRPIAEIAPFEILDAVRPFEAAKNDEKASFILSLAGEDSAYSPATAARTMAKPPRIDESEPFQAVILAKAR